MEDFHDVSASARRQKSKNPGPGVHVTDRDGVEVGDKALLEVRLVDPCEGHNLGGRQEHGDTLDWTLLTMKRKDKYHIGHPLQDNLLSQSKENGWKRQHDTEVVVEG